MDFWYFSAYFFIYAFLGWVLETVNFLVTERRLVKRGFLHAPICSIYGFGMILIIGVLTPLKSNPVALFFAGGLAATVLEYFTGYALDKAFNIRWWDYSEKKFNLGGYVCLLNSFYWCALSVFIMYFVHKHIENFATGFFAHSYAKPLIIVMICAIVFDFITTVVSLTKLKRSIAEVDALESATQEIPVVEVSKPAFNLNEYLKTKKQEHDARMAELREKIRKSFSERRFFKAYPHARSKRFKSFNEIKEYFQNANKKRQAGDKE